MYSVILVLLSSPNFLSHLPSYSSYMASLISVIALWAAALVAFFTFFHKSNLFPVSTAAFNPQCNLTQSDVQICSSFTLVTVTWTKTIQFQQRQLTVPIPLIPGSVLCPVTALQTYFQQLQPLLSLTLVTLLFLFQSGSQLQALTYSLFLRLLREKTLATWLSLRTLFWSQFPPWQGIICLLASFVV